MDAVRMPIEPPPGPFAVRLTADALDAAAAEVVAAVGAVLPSRARILVTADGTGVPGLIAPGGAAPAVIRDLEVLAVVGGALADDEALLATVELDALRWPPSGHDHEHHGEHHDAALAAKAISRGDLDGVLLVRSVRSSATGTVQRRPLWWADRIHSTATVALSYVLIDPADSVVLAAGVAVGHEERFGDVGAAIDAEPAGRRWPSLPARREDGGRESSPVAALPPGSTAPPALGQVPLDSD
jgi:hypothetical protein